MVQVLKPFEYFELKTVGEAARVLSEYGAGAEVAAESAVSITDLRSSAEYRMEMTKILVRRAIGKAQGRARR